MKPFFLLAAWIAGIVMPFTALVCQGGETAESPVPRDAKISSVTTADEAASPLARLAKAIENGDAETAWEFFGFVLHRPEPIPPIKNRKEFIDYFPILFDEAFREKMRNGSFEKDWEQLGSKVMYGNGEIWIFGSLAEGGDVIAVNYSSQAEQELRQRLWDEERKTLHESLQDQSYTPVSCFLTDDGKTAGRIDQLGDDYFRIALYKTPVHPGDKPSEIFYASAVYEGSGGNHYYLDHKWLHVISINVVGPAEMPPMEIESRSNWLDNLGESRPANTIEWKTLLQTE